MILLSLLLSQAVPEAAPRAAPPPPPPPPPGTWTTRSSMNAATQLTGMSAFVYSVDERARLVVRCDRTSPTGGNVSVQFIPKPGFAKATPRPVTIQADTGPALGANWEFPGGGAFTAQDGVVTTLTVTIAKAKAIRVRVIDPGNMPVDVTFNGPDNEARVRSVVEHCGQVFGQMPAPPPAPKPADADE